MRKSALTLLFVLCSFVWSVMAADYAGWTYGNLNPTDDSDQDGMPNLVEYAMGGVPTTADTVPFFCTQQGTNIVVGWSQRKNMTDLTIAVESTDDLSGTWGELTIDPADYSSTSLNTDFEQIQVILRNSSDQQYVRLQFTLTNGGTSSSGIYATAQGLQVALSWSEIANADSYNVYWSTQPGVTTFSSKVVSLGYNWIHTGLQDGDTIYYAVSSENAAGESTLSAEVSATVSLGIPQNVAADASDGSVSLRWNGVNGADEYVLYWDTTPNVTAVSSAITVSGIAYNHTGLTNGTSYYYAVAAKSGSTTSALSDAVLAIPGASTSLPGVPKGIVAIAGDTQIAFSWPAVTDADYYILYWGMNEVSWDSASVKVFGTSHTLTGLTNEEKYYYTVVAVNAKGESAPVLSAYTVPHAPYPPEAPEGLYLTAEADTIELVWLSDPDAVDYVVYWSTSPGVTTADTAVVLTGTSFSHTGLTLDTTYYYAVVARNAHGSSNLSDEVSALTKVVTPDIPQNLTLTSDNSSSITIRWDPSPQAVDYVLYWATDAGVLAGTQVVVSGTNYVHTGLTEDVQYFYAVAARNGTLESPPSKVDSIWFSTGTPAFGALTVSATAYNAQVELKWDTVTNVAYYRILWSTTPTVTTSSTVLMNLGATTSPFETYLHSNLTNGQTYYYGVIAVDSEGTETPMSNIVSVMPTAQATLPEKVSEVTLSASSESVYFSWDKVAGATSYQIYHSNQTDPTTFQVVSTGIIWPSTSVSGFQPGSTEYFRVGSVNAAGETLSDVLFVTMDSTLSLAAPDLYSAPLDQAIKFWWYESNNADHYSLYWSTAPIFSVLDPSVQSLHNITDTSLTLNNLTNGQRYYIKLESHDSRGLYDSALSSDPTYQTQTPAGRPVIIWDEYKVYAHPGDAQVTLYWDEMSGATQYTVKYRKYADDPDDSANWTTVTGQQSGAVVTGLSNGACYEVYVLPASNSGTSYSYVDYSNRVLFTPTAYGDIPQQSVTSLAAVASESAISLQWDEMSAIGSYRVYWSLDAHNITANSSVVYDPRFAHIELPVGTTWYYAVAPLNKHGEGPLSSVVQATTPMPVALPAAPQSLTIESGGYQRARVNWDPVAGASSYRLYWSTTSTVTTASPYVNVEDTASFRLHKGLASNSTYYYAVSSVNSQGEGPLSSTSTGFSPSGTPRGVEKFVYEKIDSTVTLNHRIWLPNHLLASGDFKGFIITDSHGLNKSMDRDNYYRYLAEKYNLFLFRAATDGLYDEEVMGDMNSRGYLERVMDTLSEEYGWSLDAKKLPMAALSLSVAAEVGSGFVEANADRTIAYLSYVSAYSTPRSYEFPTLYVANETDGRTEDIILSVRTERLRDGYYLTPIYNMDQPHNSIGHGYAATHWLDSIFSMRLPEHEILPLDLTQSLGLEYDIDYYDPTPTSKNTSEITVSNITNDLTFVQYDEMGWLPNADYAEEWPYHMEYPFSVWEQTPEADYRPANTTLTISSNTDDPNGDFSSSLWSKLSGPGTVTFGNASNDETTVSFSQSGTYVLRLSLDDNAGHARTKDLTIEID